MEVERQVFGILLFHDRNVLSEHLIVEIKGFFDGRVFIEVAADRDEQARLPSRYRRCCIENMEQPTSGKRNRQFRSERKEDLKMPVPLEAWRVQVFVGMRVLADRANVIGDKSVGGFRDLVIRDDGVVGLSEALFVDEGEVADIDAPRAQ